MKTRTLLFTLALSSTAIPSAIAGTQAIYEPAPQPVAQNNVWEWFVGGSAGYLFEADEDIYTLQLGANSPWTVSGRNIALFVEAGWTENHDNTPPPGALGGDGNMDIVPITFNVKFEKLIASQLGAYFGGGLGTSYVDSNLSGPFGGDDWVLTAQVFAGLTYHVNDNFEIFGGGRWLYLDDPDFVGASLGDDWMLEGGLRFKF